MSASRLAERQHGALIVLQRADNLDEYVRTGVLMQARVTPSCSCRFFIRIRPCMMEQ